MKTCRKSSRPDWGQHKGKNHIRVTSESSLDLYEPQPTSPAPRHSTFGHELRDDEDGLLRDHCVKLHQLVVLQSFHQVGLCQEGLHRHAPWLHRLHGHLGVPVVGGWSGRESRRRGDQSLLLIPCSPRRPRCRPASSRKPSVTTSPLQRAERGGHWLRQM